MEFISDPEMRISKISNEGNGLFDFIIHGTWRRVLEPVFLKDLGWKFR